SELWPLWALRSALRAGHVWVPQRRRSATPATSLIPPSTWPALRPEVWQQLHVPADGAVRLEQRGRALVDLLPRVERRLRRHGPAGSAPRGPSRLVYDLVSAGGPPESGDRCVGQLPPVRAAQSAVGWRDALRLRWAAQAGGGQAPQCPGATPLRPVPRAHLLC